MTNLKSARFSFLDLIRGIAVALMIYFHIFYDLNQFGYVKINFFKNPFWYNLPRVIVTLFLFAVGLSLALTHKKTFLPRPFFKRLLKIGLGAVVITISTYFMFPKSWVYFGTLHCIFLCTIVATPLLNHKVIALILGLIIYALELSGHTIPFWELSHASMDYIPLFPWLGVCFFGIFAYRLGVHKIVVPKIPGISGILFLGRHALVIYLLHQPIIFGSIFIYTKLTT